MNILARILVPLLIVGGFVLIRHHHNQKHHHKGNDNASQQASGGGKHGRQVLPPPAVLLAPVVEKTLVPTLTFIGTVTPVDTLVVRSRISGQLISLHFKQGQQVRAGQLLATVDPRPYQLQLSQALGTLAKDQASLRNTEQTLSRHRALLARHYVSSQTVDSLQAQWNELQGTITSDRAAIASAQLQISYCQITAPVDGQIGLSQVDVGNIVSSTDNQGIATLVTNQVQEVVFTLPQSRRMSISAAMISPPGITVEAWDADDRVRLGVGKLISMDNQISTSTATISMKARFSHSGDAMYPNQLVMVHLKLPPIAHALIVPLAALQQEEQGDFVWVVNDRQLAHRRIVRVENNEGQQVQISEGVKLGERVVIDGLDHLTEGGHVNLVTPMRAQTGSGAN
nr:efflux RND transporter periplasmic adaptor subunit [Serratia quinivorans]